MLMHSEVGSLKYCFQISFRKRDFILNQAITLFPPTQNSVIRTVLICQKYLPQHQRILVSLLFKHYSCKQRNLILKILFKAGGREKESRDLPIQPFRLKRKTEQDAQAALLCLKQENKPPNQPPPNTFHLVPMATPLSSGAHSVSNASDQLDSLAPAPLASSCQNLLQ